jgi:carboxypeptidase D
MGAGLQDVIAQFVPAPDDLTSAMGFAGIPVRYKQVPTGICELDPKVKSYSGYADVDKDQHMFFWFFEARSRDPSTAPLTVWINGGPGSSSMIGLFQELGPCGIDVNGSVYNNPYSWSEVSNMIFIDQPTMTGFSYSVPVPGYSDPDSGDIVVLKEGESCPENATDTCGTWSLPDLSLTANNTSNAAPNFWKTLQGFMGAFPQYSRNGFHFASESYGGHYGPVFSAYIEEQNAKEIPGAAKIKLETVLIGNGWYASTLQASMDSNY